MCAATIQSIPSTFISSPRRFPQCGFPALKRRHLHLPQFGCVRQNIPAHESGIKVNTAFGLEPPMGWVLMPAEDYTSPDVGIFKPKRSPPFSRLNATSRLRCAEPGAPTCEL